MKIKHLMINMLFKIWMLINTFIPHLPNFHWGFKRFLNLFIKATLLIPFRNDSVLGDHKYFLDDIYAKKFRHLHQLFSRHHIGTISTPVKLGSILFDTSVQQVSTIFKLHYIYTTFDLCYQCRLIDWLYDWLIDRLDRVLRRIGKISAM